VRERSTRRALQLSAGAIDVIITKGSAVMILRQQTLALVALTLLAVPPAIRAQSDQADRVRESATVFEEIMTAEDKAIPSSILDKAEGIAVFPSTVKGGFIFGAHRGRGVISARDVKSGTWSAPAFLTLTGGSFGAQIGGQSVDVVLVIMNRRGLERLLENQFKIGADASIAGGPVGRYAEASTDLQLRAEILSYSRTRGLFVGMTLQGSTIREDGDSNEAFYGRPFRTREIVLDGKATTPQSSDAVDRWIGVLKR
jgi:lipid-binding SYLF domain-containing protein